MVKEATLLQKIRQDCLQKGETYDKKQFPLKKLNKEVRNTNRRSQQQEDQQMTLTTFTPVV